jgi:hypothetical protein
LDEDIRLQIQKILSGTIEGIIENNPSELVSLSNITIHNASIHQDQDSITIAVLVYSLSKIYQRQDYARKKGWNNFNSSVLKGLNLALDAIHNNDFKEYEKILTVFFNLINKLDKGLKKYIQSVFDSAKITKASRLYEHGISLGRTADLLGITQYELMNYTGNTFIADMNESKTKDIGERIKYARRLFA